MPVRDICNFNFAGSSLSGFDVGLLDGKSKLSRALETTTFELGKLLINGVHTGTASRFGFVMIPKVGDGLDVGLEQAIEDLGKAVFRAFEVVDDMSRNITEVISEMQLLHMPKRNQRTGTHAQIGIRELPKFVMTVCHQLDEFGWIGLVWYTDYNMKKLEAGRFQDGRRGENMRDFTFMVTDISNAFFAGQGVPFFMSCVYAQGFTFTSLDRSVRLTSMRPKSAQSYPFWLCPETAGIETGLYMCPGLYVSGISNKRLCFLFQDGRFSKLRFKRDGKSTIL